MKTKLIAIVIAGLFAQGASADDMFMWGGSAEVGYRGTNIDGSNRNGAYGNTTPLSATNPLTPFTGPTDEAKAQEYQNINSAPIGVLDARGSSRTSYLRAFGEEFGRDDQFINIVGGGYGVWKASLYNNDIPHNYSFNTLSPLTGSDSTLQLGPGGTYPNAQNPATWHPYNLSTQRNTWGGNAEFSNKSPWFIKADYNEVRTNGVMPGSGQLGTGSGNGLIELGKPVDYKTQNATIEGGYRSSKYGVKLAYLDSKFTDGNDSFQWTNFYMRSGLDTTLTPPDNELKKWSINGYIKQLPWDSAIIARYTQSELTNSFGIVGSGLKPTGNAATTNPAIPPGAAYLFTQPFDSSTNQNLSNFDGKVKTTSANVAWNASPMAQLDTRVYYNYYDKSNESTAVSYRAASQGTNCATPPVNAANCYTLAALTEEATELFSYTKNAAGFDATWAFNRTNKLLGGFDWNSIERHAEDTEATKSDDYRYWLEYRNTGWENLSGRLKYEFLQRRSDLVNTAATTSVAHYYTAYDVNNFDANVVRLNVDWTPGPLWFVGLGATWRDVDYKDNLYGRTKDKNQQYDVTVSWGDVDKLRITGIGNWGNIENNQAYLAGNYPPPSPNTDANYTWGSQNTQDAWMLAALVDWAASDKLKLTASYSYQKTTGGVDFNSGNTTAGGGFQGGPLVNYVTDNTKLQRFQIKGSYDINKQWAVNAGYAYEKYDYGDGQMAGYGGYYPYFANFNTGAVGFGLRLVLGRVRQSGLHDQHRLADGDVQVRAAAAGVRGAEGCASARSGCHAAPPPPPPPPPQVVKVTLAAKALFDFDKAVLKPEGMKAIDSEIVAKLTGVQKLELVLVTGHTDPIGSQEYNQKLSERRADAVRNYLVSKGIAKDRIETLGMGKTQPIPGLVCNQTNLKAKIECYQPDRRVEVEVKGEMTKK